MVFDWVCYRHRDKHGGGLALCVQRNAQGGTMSGRAGKSGTLHSVLRGGLAGFRLLEFRRDGFPCRRPPTCWHTRCAESMLLWFCEGKANQTNPGNGHWSEFEAEPPVWERMLGRCQCCPCVPTKVCGSGCFLIKISDLFLEHRRQLTRIRRHRLTERRKMLLATF